jgi:hypothetical protein
VARFGIPGFNPGTASSGSSSTIWPWIIALNYGLFPSVSPVGFLFALNAIFLFAVCRVLFEFATRDGLSPLEIGIFAALPFLAGNVVWLVSIGMEHLLFVAATFMASRFWLFPGTVRGHARPLVAGIFCGLAITTRMEAVAFIPIFLFSAIPLRKSLTDMLFFLAPCALAVALVLLNNLWTSGSVLPATFGGRRWLYFGDHPPSALILALNLFLTSAAHVATYFFGMTTAHGNWKVSLLPIALMICGLLGLIRRQAWHLLFLIVLAATNFCAYCIMLPVMGQGMRYLAMMLIFVFPLSALGGLDLIGKVATGLRLVPSGQTLARNAIVMSFTALALYSLSDWSRITDFGIRHINGTHVRMGEWLAANLPPDVPVASFDIGAIGYFGGRRIVDLGGLSDPGFTPYLVSHETSTYLRKHDIRWLVLPMGLPDPGSGLHYSCQWLMSMLDLCDRPGMTMREEVAFSTSVDMWRVGMRATSHAAPSQVLYELSWH